MALSESQKLARIQKGKQMIVYYYQNSGITKPFSELEKVLQATDSFAKEPFYQRLGGQIEFALAGGTSMSRINDAVKALAAQNYGQLPTTRDIGIFGNILVDLSTSARTKFTLMATQAVEGLKEAGNVLKFGGIALTSTYLLGGALGLYMMFKTLGQSGARAVDRLGAAGADRIRRKNPSSAADLKIYSYITLGAAAYTKSTLLAMAGIGLLYLSKNPEKKEAFKSVASGLYGEAKNYYQTYKNPRRVKSRRKRKGRR